MKDFTLYTLCVHGTNLLSELKKNTLLKKRSPLHVCLWVV